MFKKLMCWFALVGLLTTFPIILILSAISGYILAEDDPYGEGGIEAISKSNRLIPRIVANWLGTYFYAARTLTNGNFKSKYDEFF